jgi:hypothetical protein
MRSFFNAAAQQLGTLNLLADENSGRTVEFALQLPLKAFSSVESQYSKSDSREMPI